MKHKRLKVGLIAAGCIGATAVVVYAAIATTWIHPCEDENDLECRGLWPFQTCWCNGDFNNDDHWSYGAPYNNIARVVHSNDAVTDEDHLLMAFADTPIKQLHIITDDTGGDDALDIRFENKNAGGDTITVTRGVKLDASDGKVTLTLLDEATIETN